MDAVARERLGELVGRGAAARKRVVGLAEQLFFLLQAAVMQDGPFLSGNLIVAADVLVPPAIQDSRDFCLKDLAR